MKAHKITIEQLLYCLAFILALGMRLFQLGVAPLSDVEAEWALQALGLANGLSTQLAAQPAYILLTNQLFFIFGDTSCIVSASPVTIIVSIP